MRGKAETVRKETKGASDVENVGNVVRCQTCGAYYNGLKYTSCPYCTGRTRVPKPDTERQSPAEATMEDKKGESKMRMRWSIVAVIAAAVIALTVMGIVFLPEILDRTAGGSIQEERLTEETAAEKNGQNLSGKSGKQTDAARATSSPATSEPAESAMQEEYADQDADKDTGKTGVVAVSMETTSLSSVPTSYDKGFVLQYDGLNISPKNYGSSSFIVIVQSRATVNRSAIYSVLIGSDADTCAYEWIAGSNPAHTLGFTQSGYLYIQSITSKGVSADVTIFKTR